MKAVLKNCPQVEDSLKQLAEITSPDPRQEIFVAGLAESHAELELIALHCGVPHDVRQLFETAKNVSLYSWFEYRFHQVAELVGCAAFEMALRSRAEAEFSATGEQPPQMLFKLLSTAVQRGWLCDAGFPSLHLWIRDRVHMHKLAGVIAGTPAARALEISEPTEAEISAALVAAKFTENFVKRIREIRNNLAHGARTVHPNSRRTLWELSEAMNQLFVHGADHDLRSARTAGDFRDDAAGSV